jgi:hypothetical protein
MAEQSGRLSLVAESYQAAAIEHCSQRKYLERDSSPERSGVSYQTLLPPAQGRVGSF